MTKQMQIHFNLDSISQIRYKKKEYLSLEWCEAVSEVRNWFGFVKTPAQPAGYKGLGPWVLSEEEVIRYYNCHKNDDGFYYKPYVVIIFNSLDNSINKEFNSDEEAEAWIRDVKEKTGKEFDILNI